VRSNTTPRDTTDHFSKTTMAAVPSLGDLREGVFRVPEDHSAASALTPSSGSVLVGKTRIVSLPADKASSEEVVKAFHLYLMVSGTSTDETRAHWQSFVATIVCHGFPSMRAGILKSPAYSEAVMSTAAVNQLMEWYENYMGVFNPGADDALRAACRNDAPGLWVELGLPQGEAKFDVDMADVLDIPAIYGHLSLVLFLAGKTITDTNRASITQKRPNAIERKYFNEKVVGPLSGSLALSATAHTQIHTAFVQLTHLRKEVFTRVATFNTQTEDSTFEVVATTTRLMRYAGMQQAILIDNFLSAHKEALAVPFLAPAIQAYAASMRDVMAAPAIVRPYFKIIHGDTTRAFNRNEIENLLTVALVDAREVNPTLQQYAIPPNYQLIMDRYTTALHLLSEGAE
jgi:hypothetical protein